MRQRIDRSVQALAGDLAGLNEPSHFVNRILHGLLQFQLTLQRVSLCDQFLAVLSGR